MRILQWISNLPAWLWVWLLWLLVVAAAVTVLTHNQNERNKKTQQLLEKAHFKRGQAVKIKIDGKKATVRRKWFSYRNNQIAYEVMANNGEAGYEVVDFLENELEP